MMTPFRRQHEASGKVHVSCKCTRVARASKELAQLVAANDCRALEARVACMQLHNPVNSTSWLCNVHQPCMSIRTT